MWTQFFLENLHFSINIFAALVFFAVFWLYYDAWTIDKKWREFPKIAGFFLISIAYLLHATIIESVVLPVSFLSGELVPYLVSIVKLVGYLLLILGLIAEPIQPHPNLTEESKALGGFVLPLTGIKPFEFLALIFPVNSFLTFILYLRRGTVGLEKHLKRIYISFFILSMADFVSLASVLRETANTNIHKLVSPFGFFWIIEHILTLLGIIVLASWVSRYLLKRLFTQLFMIFTLSSLVIFLVTTVGFSTLLLKNIQNESLSRLETDVKVLAYAVTAKKEGILSDASVIAQDPNVVSAVSDKERGALANLLENFLTTKKQSILVVTDAGGQVLGRGEDKERIGDSLSDDPLIKRALSGESLTSTVLNDAVLAPKISLMSAVPIKSEDAVIGAVLTGVEIDNAFVDGVESATGLKTSIYANDILSATTLTGSDLKSRPVGVKETDSSVKDSVLVKGKAYLGSVNLLSTTYYSAYLPLKDADESIVGMLFVGKPQIIIIQTAGKSIEQTFLIAAILIAFSVVPSYFIAKHIAYQVR